MEMLAYHHHRSYATDSDSASSPHQFHNMRRAHHYRISMQPHRSDALAGDRIAANVDELKWKCTIYTSISVESEFKSRVVLFASQSIPMSQPIAFVCENVPLYISLFVLCMPRCVPHRRIFDKMNENEKYEMKRKKKKKNDKCCSLIVPWPMHRGLARVCTHKSRDHSVGYFII